MNEEDAAVADKGRKMRGGIPSDSRASERDIRKETEEFCLSSCFQHVILRKKRTKKADGFPIEMAVQNQKKLPFAGANYGCSNTTDR